MSATATETVTSRASELFRFARDQHQQAPMIEDDAARATVQAVFEMAEAAMDRAKEVHAEHDRMILDLQGCVRDLTEGKLGGDRIESVEAELYAQRQRIESHAVQIQAIDRRIDEIDQRLLEIRDALITGGVATKVEPEVRVRIGHTHTLKDGWRCDSTTVEWTGRGKAEWELIRAELGLAHTVGEMEAQRRHTEALAPS